MNKSITKSYVTKSYDFYDISINNDKYNVIYNYALSIRKCKNIFSNYYFNNYLFYSYYNIYNNNIIITLCKNIRNVINDKYNINIDAVNFQIIIKDIITSYMNRCDNLKYKQKRYINKRKYIKHNSIYFTFQYIFDNYKFFDFNNNLLNDNFNDIFINLQKLYDKTHYNYYLNMINHIVKYYDKLHYLIYKIKKRLMNKVIIFKSLSFKSLNVLSHNQNMIELSNDLKLSNCVINLKIPHNDKIIILSKFNNKYHKNINFNNTLNKTTNQSRTPYSIIFMNDNNRNINEHNSNKHKLRIILYRNVNKQNKIKVNNDKETTIGVDLNTKHNLFMLSTNYIFKYDNFIITKFCTLMKHITRSQRIKDTTHNIYNNKQYNKELQNEINNMNKISTYYNNYMSYKLIQYCLQHNIKHIVLEDLNIQSKSNSYVYFKNKKNKVIKVSYNDIMKYLHLNDFKNNIKRIGNKHNIIVSFVHPAYTSQTCNICGCIDKQNRKTQETFSCVECNNKINADYNASLNIRDRVTNEKLRKKLEYYDKENNMYKSKVYYNSHRHMIKKAIEDIYKNKLIA